MVALGLLVSLSWVQLGRDCVYFAVPTGLPEPIKEVIDVLLAVGMAKSSEGNEYIKKTQGGCPSPGETGDKAAYNGSPQKGGLTPISPPTPIATVVLLFAAVIIAAIVMFYRFRRRQPSEAW